MSLVVKNAYRYPLWAQRTVHEVLRSNAEVATRELVDAAVKELRDDISTQRDKRVKSLSKLMFPSMPKSRVSAWTCRRAEVDDDTERFTRFYLLDYHKFVEAEVKTWPLIDTVLSWTYTWDTEHGYVVLHLPLAVSPERMTAGLGELAEPFSYDGRCGETDSETVDADTVASTWDRVVGTSSMGYAGATARLAGYELHQAFGLG